MSDISTWKLPDGSEYNLKDSFARTELGNKQATLVSGTNIKSIGNQALLGSGNLTVDDIGAAATSHTHSQSDITGLTSALNGKQATLVSGTNIKSIGNQSLLGSGNLTVDDIGAAESSHTHTEVNGYTIVVSNSAPASGTSNNVITFVK